MPFNAELLGKIKNRTTEEKSLELSAQSLKDKQIIELCDALTSNPNVSQIDLRGNLIGDQGVAALASVSTLEKLNLGDNRVKSEGVAALAKSNLTDLNLSSNFFNSTDLESFVGNTTLRKLDISNNSSTRITPQGIRCLKKTKIDALSICNIDIGDEGAEALSPVDDDSELPFTTLHLTQCNITDKGVQSLVRNKKLKTLNLFLNSTGLNGAQALSQHPSLTSLNVAYNQLDDEAAKKLADIPNLEEIDLSGNDKIKNPKEVISFFKSKKPFIKIQLENYTADEKKDSSVLRTPRDSESANSDHGLDPLAHFKKDECELKTASPESTSSALPALEIKIQPVRQVVKAVAPIKEDSELSAATIFSLIDPSTSVLDNDSRSSSSDDDVDSLTRLSLNREHVSKETSPQLGGSLFSTAVDKPVTHANNVSVTSTGKLQRVFLPVAKNPTSQPLQSTVAIVAPSSSRKATSVKPSVGSIPSSGNKTRASKKNLTQSVSARANTNKASAHTQQKKGLVTKLGFNKDKSASQGAPLSSVAKNVNPDATSQKNGFTRVHG